MLEAAEELTGPAVADEEVLVVFRNLFVEFELFDLIILFKSSYYASDDRGL